MRCFVCAGTHSSKLFEFEFECCTVRLGDSPRKPFHNLPTPSPFQPSLSPSLVVPLHSARVFVFFSLRSLLRPLLLRSRPLFLSPTLSLFLPRHLTLCLCRVRFLEPPSLNPNPKVRRSVAFWALIRVTALNCHRNDLNRLLSPPLLRVSLRIPVSVFFLLFVSCKRGVRLQIFSRSLLELIHDINEALT